MPGWSWYDKLGKYPAPHSKFTRCFQARLFLRLIAQNRVTASREDSCCMELDEQLDAAKYMEECGLLC